MRRLPQVVAFYFAEPVALAGWYFCLCYSVSPDKGPYGPYGTELEALTASQRVRR